MFVRPQNSSPWSLCDLEKARECASRINLRWETASSNTLQLQLPIPHTRSSQSDGGVYPRGICHVKILSFVLQIFFVAFGITALTRGNVPALATFLCADGEGGF